MGGANSGSLKKCFKSRQTVCEIRKKCCLACQ